MLKILSTLHLKFHPYTPSLELSKAKQQSFLNTLEKDLSKADPLSCTEKKYRSHNFISNPFTFFFYNLMSALLILPSILFLITKSTLRKKSFKVSSLHFSKLIPMKIIDPTSRLVSKSFSLSLSELSFIIRAFGLKVLRPYFFFRIIWKSALYFDTINKFSPKKIYCSEEMNFESPLLTLICQKYNCLHSNVMHGDKLFYIKDAFVYFDEFFVWQADFKHLFIDMKAEVQKYIYFNPVPQKYCSTTPKPKSFKYYAQHSKDLKEFEQRILNAFNFSKKHKMQFIFRPHPRHYSEAEIKIVKKYNIKVESFEKNILDSLAEAHTVCAEWSSVLFQAKFMNRELVIDNTNSKNIDKLRELNFIILNDPKVSLLLP